MTALKLLAQLKDDNFVRVTAAALNDSYELIRRFAATYCQKSGDPRLAPALIRLVTHPNISKRVNYQAMDALAYFDSTLLIQELDKRFEGLDTANYLGTIYREAASNISKRAGYPRETIETITGSGATEKNRLFEIRSLRNLTYHTLIEQLCEYVHSAPGEKQEIALIEALGWFAYSYNRQHIIDTCKSIMADTATFSEPVRLEALRTVKRLE
jgi:phosphoglycolate phosphatase-like HAD superfamily hydrolase